MTPEALAHLHARAFTYPRPYSVEEFANFTRDPACFLTWLGSDGFALGRVIGDEVELLTIAVDPDLRRNGLGRALLEDFEATARLRGAVRVFLEVAEPNMPAIALYQSHGYAIVGRRPGYYRDGDSRHDALVMAHDF